MALIDLIYIKTLKVKPAVSQLLEQQCWFGIETAHNSKLSAFDQNKINIKGTLLQAGLNIKLKFSSPYMRLCLIKRTSMTIQCGNYNARLDIYI